MRSALARCVLRFGQSLDKLGIAKNKFLATYMSNCRQQEQERTPMGIMPKYAILPIFGLIFMISACAGPDYDPVYFPIKEPAASEALPPEKKPDEGIAVGSCTVNFKSELCVIIYGESVQVGTEGEEPLCAELDPIPIEVNGGTNLILRGNTFPDIPFEGHGLPAPIMINGKGTTDGSQNLGRGKVDQPGNITIEGFSFFINALGMVGELSDLTLTTGKTEKLEGLEEIEGSPLADDGKLKLVIGTTIGHLFPAADEKLYGASLQAVFEGTVTPQLSECKGSDSKPQSSFVTKLVVDENGRQTEAMLPGSTRMEVGRVFISQGPQDIGPNFESSAKFKIINASAKAFDIDIPQIVGPFNIEATQGGPLKQSLPPKTPLIIKVSFRPTLENTPKEGEVSEILAIGPDVYQLVGEAVKPSAKISIDVEEEGGKFSQAGDTVKLGDVEVSTAGRREFFSCKKINCNGVEKLTQCVPCVDVLINVCQLLSVDKNGSPVEAVDSKCQPENKNGRNSFSIGLGSDAVVPAKRAIEVKNNGVKPLTINSVEIQEIPGSKSVHQFKVNPNIGLPVTIRPYDISNESFSVIVIYEPDDLIGFDGSEAVVGRPVKDMAVLRVAGGDSSSTIELVGTTTVREVPALQVYFKSATGTKEQTDGSEFAFRGLTQDSTDLAVPVFIKLSDSASKSIRITNFSVSSSFEWLDTKEKIDSKPENSRCAIPVFDANGGVVSRITDLNPSSLLPNGFDLKPGAYTTGTMPLFGCVNFNRGAENKRQYKGLLTISTTELDENGQPARNPDGSLKQTTFNINLLAVINPMKGKIVFRITQAMAAIMNPQFPGVSSVASKKEMDIHIADGLASESDRFVLPTAMVLDPFDEETIKDESGNIVTAPGDGITAVYRKMDTRPVPDEYDDPLLGDFASVVFDSTAKDGEKGIFFDYPNIPENTKFTGLRMFTSSLSYPGPLASPSERPENISLCQQVNPCSKEGQNMHGEGPSDKSKRGVCAFLYGSAGTWDSPALHFSSEMEGGTRVDMCKMTEKYRKLNDIGGHYNLNGSMNFVDVGLHIFGPTYFNNPKGPLGPYQPIDTVFHTAFTTGVIKPAASKKDYNLIPEKRVNIAKQEYKINLNDTKLETPPLCDNSVKNRYIHGEYYSTWKYLAPLLVKDEAGTTLAGCPEADNNFTGGSAFIRGRPLDQETGVATFVTASKFASDDNLTFAFKDVMFFVIYNGWFCDPTGPEDRFEGSHCFDNTFNERDAMSTISIIE